MSKEYGDMHAGKQAAGNTPRVVVGGRDKARDGVNNAR